MASTWPSWLRTRENKRQNQAVDEWLEAVAGVYDVADHAVKNEPASASSSATGKKWKDFVIDISDEED
jgi:aromatic ring hydroxylase